MLFLAQGTSRGICILARHACCIYVLLPAVEELRVGKNIYGQASILAQQVKPTPTTRASHIGMVVRVLAAPLPVPLLVNVSGPMLRPLPST